MNYENNFKITIQDDNREFIFKVELDRTIDGLLFHIANFTEGYKKEKLSNSTDFTFKFFNTEDFDEIVKWAKEYGEIL